jgi:3-oxoacyl-[acyl-carrier protein] reductase
MPEDSGKVLVVTGGNSGIGRGIALHFGRAGYRVAILGRNAETLRTTAQEIGPGCLWFQADVSHRDQVVAAVRAIVESWSRIDVLVNNSGLSSPILTTTPIEEAERRFRDTIDVNLTGPFLMVMAVAPHLSRPGGRIINISSIAAFHGGRHPGSSAYAASKSGLNALTHAFARELSPEGITVNGIAPGYIETPMTARWSDERRQAGMQAILAGRAGTPADIAAAAFYLASPEAAFVTGEILNVNGGSLFVH